MAAEKKVIYLKLVEQLTRSVKGGLQQFYKQRKGKNKFKVIPGWNRNLKCLHNSVREHYLKWLELGRRRDTVEFENMNNSRKVFKKALKKCKLNEFNEICKSIEEKYKSKHMTQF